MKQLTTVSDGRLNIPLSVYLEILSLAKKAEGEISGFGRTTTSSDVSKHVYLRTEDIQVHEVAIFKQECNPVHTSLDGEALTQMYVRAAQSGGNPEQWNFWWHSHVEMDVYFSTTDTGTLKRITKDGGRLVALCINKFGETTAVVFENGAHVSDLNVCIIPEDTDERFNHLLERAEEKIKENVKHLEFAPRKALPKFKFSKHSYYGGSYLDEETTDGVYSSIRNYLD